LAVTHWSAWARAIARGAGPQQGDETVTGQWNLYVYPALRGGDLPPAGDDAATEAWIWNQGTPVDIPTVDDHRMILLGDPSYRRTWRAQRMFPDLRATLDANDLAGADVGAWLHGIETAAG
jgi:hypothetical protein